MRVDLILDRADVVLVELIADRFRMLVVEDGRSVILTWIIEDSVTSRVGIDEGRKIVDLALYDEPQIVALIVFGDFLRRVLLNVESWN